MRHLITNTSELAGSDVCERFSKPGCKIDNMAIKTYVINLKDSVERRNNVLTELLKYPFMDYELVEAVDGRNMSHADIDRQFDCMRFFYRMRREVLPGEVGCTLSHMECYRKLLSSKDEVALILEDDVGFLADTESVKELLEGIIRQMDDKPCVVTLSRHLNYYIWGKRQIGAYTLCRVRDALGTCAYLINRKAAAILLNIHKPYFVADDYLLMNEYGIRVKSIYPMVAVGASEIHKIPSLINKDWGAVTFSKIPLFYKVKIWISRGCRRLLYITKILRRRKNEIYDFIN